MDTNGYPVWKKHWRQVFFSGLIQANWKIFTKMCHRNTHSYKTLHLISNNSHWWGKFNTSALWHQSDLSKLRTIKLTVSTILSGFSPNAFFICRNPHICNVAGLQLINASVHATDFTTAKRIALSVRHVIA